MFRLGHFKSEMIIRQHSTSIVNVTSVASVRHVIEMQLDELCIKKFKIVDPFHLLEVNSFIINQVSLHLPIPHELPSILI